MQMQRRILRIVFFAVLMLGPAIWTAPTAAAVRTVKTPDEYQLKAVFLYNIARFVEWPPGWRGGEFFLLGIYGDDPFGEIIDRAVAGERLHGREVKVVRYSSLAELAGRPAEVLFVASSAMADFALLHRELAGMPVLTVADTPGFLEIGGMVNLVKSQRQIELQINRTAVARSDLFISSKLLRLATVTE